MTNSVNFLLGLTEGNPTYSQVPHGVSVLDTVIESLGGEVVSIHLHSIRVCVGLIFVHPIVSVDSGVTTEVALRDVSQPPMVTESVRVLLPLPVTKVPGPTVNKTNVDMTSGGTF